MRRITQVMSVGLAAALALTGCASTKIQTFSAMREASTLGTEICVTNKTDMNVRIKWRGYPNARPIAPGFQNCNSGYETNVPDVAAVLEYAPNSQPGEPLTLLVEGNNDWFFDASASVYFMRGQEQRGVKNLGYAGDSRSFQENGIRVTITRLPDSGSNKEWDITLSPPSGADYSEDITPRPGPAV